MFSCKGSLYINTFTKLPIIIPKIKHITYIVILMLKVHIIMYTCSIFLYYITETIPAYADIIPVKINITRNI